ncbi:putative reverse transcriptase domain-containing protein [Tanacetum coccineum]
MKETMAWRCLACDDLMKDYLCVPCLSKTSNTQLQFPLRNPNGGVTEWYQEPKISIPNHVDDLPVVKPNQPDIVPVIPDPVLLDEGEDPEEEEFEEEEEPQEEDDMEVDIEEDENEPELTFPYEEADPLNPLPPASDSEPEDVIEVEDTDSDGMLPGLMRRDINSLFGRIASLSRRLCGRETAHALVEKKGKAKDEYYGKLILDLGNEVRSSVEEGTAAMENLVRKLGNAEERAECKKLKKELEEARIMPPKSAPLTQAAVRRMIKESVNAAILLSGQDMRMLGIMLCNPDNFRSTKGAVELRIWFEKTEMTFGISECAENKKVKFDAATLRGPALTWWNSKVAILGLDVANQIGWTEMKKLMTAEFCPAEELQRMENELWNLKVKEYNMVAYTQRFNELALMYPRMVEPESVKVDAYIRGFSDNIKGEVTSSKPTNLNEAVRMAHKLMEQKLCLLDDFLCVSVVLLVMLVNVRSSATSVERLGTKRGHTRNRCPKKVKKEEVGEARGRAYIPLRMLSRKVQMWLRYVSTQ